MGEMEHKGIKFIKGSFPEEIIYRKKLSMLDLKNQRKKNFIR